ncbi:MAG: SMC-Scp complex subunit ScpB [Candidatus Krumholzibacteriota bacterium]|nr:SMC-Scp complex subunit ScpB [Candidatus Krumholzibacteriota bacterium]
MISQGPDKSEENKLAGDIEALLFASHEPLSISRISSITGITSAREIKENISILEDFYRDHNRSFQIIEVAGGYQLATLPEYSHTVNKLYKSRRKSRLSQAALETLAIIAYKQPINRVQIEAIRGVSCEGVVATLVDRELITITGRGEGVGRPYLYSTTNKFLEYLGLKNYRDLPSLEELEKNLEMLELIPPPEYGGRGEGKNGKGSAEPSAASGENGEAGHSSSSGRESGEDSSAEEGETGGEYSPPQSPVEKSDPFPAGEEKLDTGSE